jgi:TP901 family phage tail tape measure protein
MRKKKYKNVIETVHKDSTGGFVRLKQNLKNLFSPMQGVTSELKNLKGQEKKTADMSDMIRSLDQLKSKFLGVDKAIEGASQELKKFSKQDGPKNQLSPLPGKRMPGGGSGISTSQVLGLMGLARFAPSIGVGLAGMGPVGWGLAGVGVLGAMGAYSFMSHSLDTAAEAESEFIKMQEAVKRAGKSFSELQERIEELGAKTKFTATDGYIAAKQMGASGWNSEQIFHALPVLMNITGAAQITSDIGLPEVTEKLVDIMNSYDVKSDQAEIFGDQIAYAITNSSQSFSQLMDALNTFAPIAKSIGIPKEHAIAHVMVLADKGIKESVAGTAMAGFIARMPSLPKEARDIITSKFSKKEYEGFYNLKTGKIKNLSRIFELFKEKKLTTGEISTIMGQEAGKYLISLVDKDAIIKIRSNTASLGDSKIKGIAQRLGDTNTKGYLGAVELLDSSLDGTMNKIFNKGPLKAADYAVRKATTVVDYSSSFLDQKKEPSKKPEPLRIHITADKLPPGIGVEVNKKPIWADLPHGSMWAP